MGAHKKSRLKTRMCSRAAYLPRRSQRPYGTAGSLRLVLPPPREFHCRCPHQEGARAGIAAEEIEALSSVRNGRGAFSSPRSSPTAARRSAKGFPRCLLAVVSLLEHGLADGAAAWQAALKMIEEDDNLSWSVATLGILQTNPTRLFLFSPQLFWILPSRSNRP